MAPRDIEAVRRPPRIRAYPPWYWDREASRWDEVVATPTNPHQFYYREADYLIAEILETRMRALELACGTGGSTAMQCRHVSDLVATDFSVKMVQQAAHRQNCNLVQFLVADASGLPFRGGTFRGLQSRCSTQLRARSNADAARSPSGLASRRQPRSRCDEPNSREFAETYEAVLHDGWETRLCGICCPIGIAGSLDPLARPALTVCRARQEGGEA